MIVSNNVVVEVRFRLLSRSPHVSHPH